MTDNSELFKAAKLTANVLRYNRETKKVFEHDAGSVQGWRVCTTMLQNNVGWAAQSDIILTPDGTLYSLYILAVTRADTENRTPRKTLTRITNTHAWPEEHKLLTLQMLRELARQ